MWQQIIVYSIGILAVVYIAIAVYRLVTRKGNPCAGCAGCDLKRDFEQKRRTCTPEEQAGCCDIKTGKR